MRISDWSSDVCSSDLGTARRLSPFIPDPGGEMIFVGRNHIFAVANDGKAVAVGILRIVTAIALKPNEGWGWLLAGRPEERRGGKAGVSTCRSRWSRYH